MGLGNNFFAATRQVVLKLSRTKAVNCLSLFHNRPHCSYGVFRGESTQTLLPCHCTDRKPRTTGKLLLQGHTASDECGHSRMGLGYYF